MDAPIQFFFSILSGSYEKRQEQSNGIKYEVYFDKHHPYNIDRMMLGMKDAVAYCSKAFSPFQYRQMRIIEFPRYASFAQSFPNTVPFSEAIGFIASIKNKNDIDYVYYVTAHEVAHQWWGHQLAEADLQGAAMLIESLAQYSALMIMEHKYGRDHMKHFLNLELNTYLSGRKFDSDHEQPLFRCENQNYIHYNKGSLVFYALKDYLGEARLNQILSDYLKPRAFSGPPFARSRDFVAHLYKSIPDSNHYLVSDMLEHIVLYANKTDKPSYKLRKDGRYDLSIPYESAKFISDSLGNQKELPFNEYIDVGVTENRNDGKLHFIYLQKHKIANGKGKINIIVDRKPEKAGIDPLNILIDREPDDNLVEIHPAQ
jgi:aminopeptidase N